MHLNHPHDVMYISACMQANPDGILKITSSPNRSIFLLLLLAFLYSIGETWSIGGIV